MLKALAFLAVVVASASASAIYTGPTIVRKGLAPKDGSALGVVDPAYRCGGVGTPLQLRISECEGRCSFNPGQVYNCEKDFMPAAAAPGLTLKVELCMSSGFCMQIFEVDLPNSSIQPGFIYTAKYSIVPNDILSGQAVEFKAYISHTNNGLLEICVSADITIN